MAAPVVGGVSELGGDGRPSGAPQGWGGPHGRRGQTTLEALKGSQRLSKDRGSGLQGGGVQQGKLGGRGGPGPAVAPRSPALPLQAKTARTSPWVCRPPLQASDAVAGWGPLVLGTRGE